MATNQAKLAPNTNDIDWGVIDGSNTQFETQYPRFQWVHGSPQASGFMKTGGLFVSAENFPNFEGEGFSPETLITRDGTDIPGFGAKSTQIAVIRVKQQWIKDEQYGKNVPLRHVLAVVKGSDDVINISLKGASKALVFQKAFEAHMGQNVALANRTRPQGSPMIEPFALWFPLQAGALQKATSKDGKSTSTVTPPELLVPSTLDRDYVVSLWVGADNYRRFIDIYRDTEAWQKKPIWEQNHADDPNDDTPAFSRSDNGITKGQIQMIAGLMEVKQTDEAELMDLCYTVSSGSVSSLDNLTRDEANALIELLGKS